LSGAAGGEAGPLTVDALDGLPVGAARERLAACCGSRRWVEGMLAARPFGSSEGLYAAAERVADGLGREDWLEAFAHHPRIGDREALRARFGARAGGWSAGEQAGVSGAEEAVLAALEAGNRRYEERFGHLFIVCATGKTAAEMLALLTARLDAAPQQELATAAGEQRKITRLRLAKLVGEAVR
jgi:2-oxo-4-hydroxy-4-carboxy-5-ureidoimidazoline decarboxylase